MTLSSLYARISSRIARLEKALSPRPAGWRTDVAKIVLDKVLLAAALLWAGFCFNKSLEDYRSQKAWLAEVARQKLTVARDLVEAAYNLRAAHTEAALAAQRTPNTFDTQYQSTLAAQYRAAFELTAKCETARIFLPEEVIAKYELYRDRVQAADLRDLNALASVNDLDISLLAAVRAQSAAVAAILLSTSQPVSPSRASSSSLPTCEPPVAVTGAVSKLTAHDALLEGQARGRVIVSWFDFDLQPEPRYSVQAIGGRGQASGLAPNTKYYYRYVVRNECGASRGELRSFTTPGS